MAKCRPRRPCREREREGGGTWNAEVPWRGGIPAPPSQKSGCCLCLGVSCPGFALSWVLFFPASCIFLDPGGFFSLDPVFFPGSCFPQILLFPGCQELSPAGSTSPPQGNPGDAPAGSGRDRAGILRESRNVGMRECRDPAGMRECGNFGVIQAWIHSWRIQVAKPGLGISRIKRDEKNSAAFFFFPSIPGPIPSGERNGSPDPAAPGPPR